MTRNIQYEHFTESIYNHKRNIENSINNIIDLVKQGKISEKNKDFIFEFCKERKIKLNLTDGRISKYYTQLKQIALIIMVDFDKVDKKAYHKFIEYTYNRNNISDATKWDYITVSKTFFKWLNGDEDYPEFIKGIKRNFKQKTRNPNEILNDQDVLNMVNVCGNLRDKSIIAVLYDSGMRISELLNLRFKDISYDDLQGTMNLTITTSKTGKGRNVLLITSVKYLTDYINSIQASIKNNPHSFVFLMMYKNTYLNKQMTYPSVVRTLERKDILAKINKPVNPHAFRRASATNSSSFLTDSELMIRYGWTKRETVSSYTFLNEKVVNDKLLQRYGKIPLNEAFKKSELEHVVCLNCGKESENNTLCSNCARPLSLKHSIEIQSQRQKEIETLISVIDIFKELIPKEKMTQETINKLKELKNNLNNQ